MQLINSVRQWMEDYKKLSVKTATYDRLIISLTLMSKYPIAYIETQTITPKDLQTYIAELVNDNYAQTTIKKQFNLLSAFIKYANTEGIIDRPIYNAVKLPSQSAVKKPKRDTDAYTPDEQEKLIKVLHDDSSTSYKILLFMLETGLRVGEALALSWSDVMWRKRAIKVCKTLARLSNKDKAFIQDSPKSRSSNRIIPLSSEAMRILESIHRNDIGTVFQGQDGQPFSYKILKDDTEEACKIAGVPYLGQHVFRHTFATNCYYKGCDVKVLSKLLGHSSVKVTYDAYINLYGDALEEMRAIIG